VEIFGVDAWLFWFLLAVGLLVVELLIAFTFYAAPVALGAFAASILAALDTGIELQLTAFIAGSLAAVLLLRPIVRQHLFPPAPEKRSNVQGLIGRRAVVVEPVDIDAGTVRIGDDTWSARAEEEGMRLEAGERAEVVSVSGVYAFVRPAPIGKGVENE
jgi:membrane protein implicated in regulation of membrane protease activity